MANWDLIYAEKTVVDANAADVLINNKQLLPEKGKALDYACGLSANGVFLASRGFEVTAWDSSEVAVDKVNGYASENKLPLYAEKKDLESGRENKLNDFNVQFDIIIVSYFLHRQTLRTLYDYLIPGGLLFYETFSGKQIENRGPSNENFRLQRGELLSVFSDMQILYYREDDTAESNESEKYDKVYFVAKK